MSFNTKTTALSAAALLAVMGGIYALMSHNRESASNGHIMVSSTQAGAKLEAAGSQLLPSEPSGEKAKAQVANATTAQQASVPAEPSSQAPKKLTKAQLTPPPATEEEKLQRAAQQESNF